MSKLSPHVINIPVDVLGGIHPKLAAWHPPVYKGIDHNPDDVLNTYLRSPGTIIVLRNHPRSEEKAQMLADPTGTGIRHAREWRAELDRIKAHFAARGVPYPGDQHFICLSINEPGAADRSRDGKPVPRTRVGVLETRSSRRVVAEYNRSGMVEGRRLNIRWGAFNFSVSWPGGTREPANPDAWLDFAVCRALLADGWHVYCSHEYWGAEGPDTYWGGFAGRITRIPWTEPGMRFLVGEAGIDMVHGVDPKRGFRDHGITEDAFYTHHLQKYDRRLSAEMGARLLGITPFSIGGSPEWDSFRLQWRVVDLMVANAGDNPPPAPPPPSPPPTPPPAPPPGTTGRELIGFNVATWLSVEEAQVAAGQPYWFLKRAKFVDEAEAGGKQNIYILDPHNPALRGFAVNRAGTRFIFQLDKPANEPAGNMPMWAGNVYAVGMDDILPTDVLMGCEMRGNRHVCYELTFERRTKAAPPPPTPPPSPPPAPPPGTELLWNKLAWAFEQAARILQGEGFTREHDYLMNSEFYRNIIRERDT